MEIGRTARRSVAIGLLMFAGSCSAADRDIEPDDLDVRDLLGLSPSVAARWDGDERAAARASLMGAWADTWTDDGATAVVVDSSGEFPSQAEEAVAALAHLDRTRAEAGQVPIIGGVGEVQDGRLRVSIASPIDLDREPDRSPGDSASRDTTARAAQLVEPVQWRPEEAAFAERGAAWALELAAAAGHPQGARLRLRAAPQAPFGAVYLGEELGLLLNPVVLAALEPAPPSSSPPALASPLLRHGGGSDPTLVGPPPALSQPFGAGGNPYSFYGSVAECAAAQRLRCEACLPSATCEQTSRDAADGNAECETLASGEGAGYHLYCINLSLAIATVADCASDEGPGCGQDRAASNQIARLDANRVFLNDAACRGALDDCLATIYGEPGDDFPPPPPDAGPAPDGGTPPSSPPPPSPRETSISCGQADCDFSPQCDSSCSGNCDQVYSCDSDCNGGNNGRNDGCGGDGGGGSGGSGDGCGSGGGDGGGGGGGSGGNGCDSDCGGSGSSGSGSDCDNGDCGNGDCGNGDCGNGDCGNGDCSSSSGGGGGGNCTVARGARTAGGERACVRRRASPDVLASLAWAILPLPYLERSRRRARRRQLARSNQGVSR